MSNKQPIPSAPQADLERLPRRGGVFVEALTTRMTVLDDAKGDVLHAAQASDPLALQSAPETTSDVQTEQQFRDSDATPVYVTQETADLQPAASRYSEAELTNIGGMATRLVDFNQAFNLHDSDFDASDEYLDALQYGTKDEYGLAA